MHSLISKTVLINYIVKCYYIIFIKYTLFIFKYNFFLHFVRMCENHARDYGMML